MRDGHVSAVMHRVRGHVVPLDVVADLDHELLRIRDCDHRVDEIVGSARIRELDQIPGIDPEIFALKDHPRLHGLVVHGLGGLEHIVDVDRGRRRHPGRSHRHAEIGRGIRDVVLSERFQARKLVFLDPREGFTVDLQRPYVCPTRCGKEGHHARPRPRLGVSTQELSRRERATTVFGKHQTLPALAAFGAHLTALTITDEQLDRRDLALDVIRDLDTLTGRAETEESDVLLGPDRFPAADEGQPTAIQIRRIRLCSSR